MFKIEVVDCISYIIRTHVYEAHKLNWPFDFNMGNWLGSMPNWCKDIEWAEFEHFDSTHTIDTVPNPVYAPSFVTAWSMILREAIMEVTHNFILFFVKITSNLYDLLITSLKISLAMYNCLSQNFGTMSFFSS